jgi:hypothetical protein
MAKPWEQNWSVQSADTPQGNRKPWEKQWQVEPEPERGVTDVISDMGTALWEGVKTTGRMVGASGNTYTGDLRDVEDYALRQQLAQEKRPEAVKALTAEFERRKKANPEGGLMDAIRDVGGAMIDNPEGSAQFVIEQAPNSAVALGAGWAGAKAGAAGGLALGGPVGAAVGGIGGFLGGMFLGNTLLETGGKAIEKAEGGFTKAERGEAMREGAVKGGVITGVDAVTLGAGNVLAKSFGKAAINAGARAEARVLADAGVDLTSRTAIEVALAANPALRETAKAAGEAAAKSASTVGAKASAAGTGLTLETAGEGTGEYLGELAATGEANVYDAVMESAAGFSQSVPETAWNLRQASGNDLNARNIQRQGADLQGTPPGTPPATPPGQPPATPGAPAAQAPATPPAAPPATNPTARLAELELFAEQRDLTPTEQREAIDLLTALNEQDATQDTEGITPEAAPVEAAAPEGGDATGPAGVPAEPAAASVEAAGVEPAGREGYDTPVELDAASLKAIVEQTQGTPLVDKPAKLEAWRNGTAKTDPNKFPIELALQPDGRLNVNDGRHRIALAAERGEKVTAFIDGKDAQRVQELLAAPQPAPTDFWSFAKSKGYTPGQIQIGTPEHAALKAEYDALKNPEPILPPMTPPQNTDLQNRDRGRAASVVQMSDIARNPDYMRLGPSRTPDSGAPMVFAVGDQINIEPQAFGRQDVAVMSDGQRVPFRYAVVDATQVNPSNFADGRQNPEFNSTTPGTLKALNNGRTAGVRAAHEIGTAGEYVSGMQADAAMHGIPADVIARTPNPILVRVYSDADNTVGMAAKSQGQGLDLSPEEYARQDAPLYDSSVLGVYAGGDVNTAANRDFVRAVIGKLQAAGQPVGGMMTATGELSPTGMRRIQAGLMQAAYGDADLVAEMFGSIDTDIKAIGEALKSVAGQWANMRDSAKLGAINPQADITENLIQAIGLIRKARRDRQALYDLVRQPDLMTGEAPSEMTVRALRMFYDGQYFTRAVGRDRLTDALEQYVRGAMVTSADAGMFGDVVTPTEILATINLTEAPNAETEPQEGRGQPAGSDVAGVGVDPAGPEAQQQNADRGGTGPVADSRAEPGQDAPVAAEQQVGEGDQGTAQGDGAATQRADAGQQEDSAREAAPARGRQGAPEGQGLNDWKEHRRIEAQLDVAMRGTDVQKQLDLIRQKDAAVAKLIEAGATQDEIGANALGVSVEHFRDLVKAGTYSREYGAADSLFPTKPKKPARKAEGEGVDAPYLGLLALKSTTLLSESGGRKLYAVTLTPAFKAKYFVAGRGFNLPRSDAFELKEKARVTGVASDSGYILIDRREQQTGSSTEAAAPARKAKSEAVTPEEGAAEQAIRDAFQALPSVTLGEFYPITVTHNGRTQQFLASQRALKRPNQPHAALTLVQIRQGRLVAGMDLQDLAYTFKLTGKNELTEESVKPASDGQYKRWREAGFQTTERQSAPAQSGQQQAGRTIERGRVGMDLKSGQVVLTATGRETTPYPKFERGTAAESPDGFYRENRWLITNAYEEAKSRGDDAATGRFESINFAMRDIPQTDKTAAWEYLFNDPAADPILTAPTAEEVVARQDAAEAAQREQEAADRKAAAEEDKRREREEIRRRSEAAADDFQLGQNAMDNLTGQRDIFSAPAEPTPPAPDAAAKAKAKADLDAALGDLGDIFGQSSRSYLITPEQEQKLIPVLTRVMDAAFRMGYYKFKDAARFALNMIRDKFGNTVADSITVDHLQGAYIGMAGKYQGQGASTKKDVVAVESIQEIMAEEPQGAQDVPGANDRVERDRQEPAAGPAVGDAVPADTGGTARGDGETGGRAGRGTGRGQSGGAGFQAGVTTASGERSDFSVPGGNPAVVIADSVAGTDFAERGPDIGLDGVSTDPVPAAQVEAAATTGDERVQREGKQRQADRVEVKPGDLANIKATLPYLLDGQQEDVLKAEQRFAQPDGYGMLFTNGTGTGKTFTGLGVVKRFARQGKTNTLIIVPDDKIAADWIESGKALGLNITKIKDTKDAGSGIVVATYANLGDNDALANRRWDLFVPDEAHTLMQAADGKPTGYLTNLRALSLHPDGVHARYSMLNRPDIQRAAALKEQIESNEKIMSNPDTMDVMVSSLRQENVKLEREYLALRKKLDDALTAVKTDVAENQGAKRPRAVFLSATPFAYEFNVDWANGYLFNYDEGQASDQREFRGYNQGSNRDRFFMQHFGYTMRYNKLTKPDPSKVDTGLMQRTFNGWLKKKGSLSGRMLDVKADYDRRFVLVDSAIGNRIDEALNWIRERSHNEGKGDRGFQALGSVLMDKFDYLSRRYLLEAIKATEAVPIVREHLKLNRKVVVFHDYKKGGGFNPFDITIGDSSQLSEDLRQDAEALRDAVTEFRAKFKDLVEAPLGRLPSPIDVFKREFPDVLLINGDEKKTDLLERYKTFQSDDTGPTVMLVQSAKNKGWSGHDTSGKYQRVLINLGQPTAPTLAIQQEGRIYRTGQVSNAIMRYLNTGTDWEKVAFATTIAGRASTAENLGMGELSRALKDSFISAFEESDAYPPGHEGEGTGGKERDQAQNNALTAYDRAKTYYWATQKKNSRTKAQEGKDYFATPEPLGLKMAEWLGLRGGEDALEPSGGHGAIARWLPETSRRTVIEPSNSLRARLMMAMDPNSDRIIDGTFEEHNVVNKYDGVAMNPPFGVGGKTAIEHVAKAATHLRDGGRIVALIPTGPAADKRFEQWMYGTEQRPVKPTIKHPELGDIYVGDTVKSRAAWAPEGKVVRSRDGALWVKVPGRPGESLVNMQAVTDVQPTGARTREVRPADGIYMVGEIKLPQVTFERAGTAVATRIVILEKQSDPARAPAQRNVDLSDITDIRELFDRIEDLAMPERAMTPAQQAAADAAKAEEERQAKKAEKAEAKATGKDTPKAANPDAVGTVERAGEEVIEHTTQKGKVIRGIVRTDLMKEEAQKIDPYTFRKNGGWFIREVYLKDDGTAMFSRGRPGTMTESTVRQVAETIAARWAQAPTVVVVPNMQDMRVPQAVRDEDARQRAGGATGVPRGFYHRGTVYLVADGLKSVSDAAEALFHEALGHYGLRAVFGTALNDILDQIAMARPDLMRKKAEEYGKDLTVLKQRREVAEEVLAEMAQTKPNIGFVKRAIAAIRTWLRQNVPALKDMALTDAEIINSFILPARGWVERGERAMRPGGKVAFDRGGADQTQDQNLTEAFKRWFGNSKVVDADGKPLVVYHGTIVRPTRDGTMMGDIMAFDRLFTTKFRAPSLDTVGSWFSTNPGDGGAEMYAGGGRAPGAAIYPAYLSIKNPHVTTFQLLQRRARLLANGKDDGRMIGQAEVDALRKWLKDIGKDGIKIEGSGNEGSTEFDNQVAWIALEPTQIKSATGNNGNFDPANPDIRFSRSTLGNQPPQQPSGQQTAWQKLKAKALELTSPEAIDNLIYELQDKNIDLKRLRDHIKELGGTISDLNDAYLGEELYHKRLAKRTQDFLSEELRPLMAELRTRGLDLPTLERYLHARHAPEANRVLAERNPNTQMIVAGRQKAAQDVKALEVQLQRARTQGTATKAIEQALDLAREELSRWTGVQAFKGTEAERTSLSGMSDKEAADFVANLPAGQKVHLDALAARVDAMNAKTLNTLEKYGLMEKSSLDTWRNTYQFYVPLHRDEAHPDATSHPIGQGFSTKGDASKRRTGSNEKVTNILAHVAMQREAALTRGEKNRVAKKLYLMAGQNPDPEVWTVDKPPMTKTVDRETGFVRTGVDPTYKNKPNVVMVRIGGKDHAIVFNERNPKAVRMAQSIKSADLGDLNAFDSVMGKATRWLASVNTQYNPIFGMINFARDVQAALLQLSTTPLKGQERAVAAYVMPAMKGIYSETRARRKGQARGTGDWARLWEEMQDEGGTTGFRELFIDPNERVKALEKELKALDRGQAAEAAHAVVDWLSDYNETMENAVRLASYKVALDQGMSKERAASVAKNITVNFNRKGRQTAKLAAYYAFLNAAIQGTTRMAETLRGPAGKKIMLGGVMLGAVNTLIAMTMMGAGEDEDNWEKIPEFVKERSIIIPLGREDFLAIPMPLGFHVLPNIGRKAVEMMLHNDPTEGAGVHFADMLRLTLDAFNPLGGSENLAQMITPTPFDPAIALVQNRDWTGKPIYREDNSNLDPTPGHTRTKDTASTFSKGVSEALVKISGGTDYQAGAINWTPDQIDYIIGQLTGGLGREVMKLEQTITAPITGEELPPHKIPLVGRIYGNTRGPSSESEKFYENLVKLNGIEREIKGRARDGEDYETFMAEEPLADLVGLGNSAQNQISKLRQARREVVRQGLPGFQDEAKELNQQIGDVMKIVNQEVKQAKRDAAARQ